MPDVSVLLPTAGRPAFLAHALASVARQTAVHRIGEVVVMENGGDPTSKEICKKFPQLPIRYEYRDPQITAHLPLNWFAEPRFPIAAMLHDDDWWADFHLERSLACLEQHPGASVFYSAAYTISGEKAPIGGLFGSFVAWFANDSAPPGELRVIEFKDVLVGSLLATGFHMSGLVYFQSAMGPCLPALGDGNTYDVDRTLAVELSRQGKLLFHETPAVFVRIHAAQDSQEEKDSGRAQVWFPRNTARLIALARDSGIDIKKELSERVARMGLDMEKIFNRSHPGAMDVLFDHSLLPPAVSDDFARIHRAPMSAPEKPKKRRSKIFRFFRSR